MNFETELKDRLHAGVDDTPVEIDRLIEGGRIAGRRFTRRRRIGQVLAAVTATAAVTGAVVAIGGMAREPAIGPAAPVATSATVAKPSGEPITPQAAWKIVTDQLPKGARYKDVRGGVAGSVENPQVVWARSIYVDGGGPSNLAVDLDWTQSGTECLGEDEICTTETLPDGRKVVLLKSSGPGDYLRYSVRVQFKDGWKLSVMSDNASSWKGEGARALPPLTQANLRAIALDKRLQKRVPADLVKSSAHLFATQVSPAKTEPTGPTSPDPSASNGSPR